MNKALHNLQLNFDENSLMLLNICLAVIMFGIALNIRIEDFKILFKNPKAPLMGLISQFVLLPLLTFGLIYFMNPLPGIALGMMLVAACPGGNISNFMSHLAGANTALSVSLTACATLLSLVLTPLNFQLYASLYPPTAQLLQEISIDPNRVFRTILLILALPLLAGILVQYRFPGFAQKASKPLKMLSILIFIGFVVVAFFNNREIFVNHIRHVLLLVFLHNGLALGMGYLWAKVTKLSPRNQRTLSIETGIQNSGLGLLLIFSFFNGMGGMALTAGWWGIWHIISGLCLAFVWSRKPVMQQA